MGSWSVNENRVPAWTDDDGKEHLLSVASLAFDLGGRFSADAARNALVDLIEQHGDVAELTAERDRLREAIEGHREAERAACCCARCFDNLALDVPDDPRVALWAALGESPIPDGPTERWVPSQEALAAATTTMTVYGPDGPTEMLVLRHPLLPSRPTGEERDR